jgi:hypothetical protein
MAKVPRKEQRAVFAFSLSHYPEPEKFTIRASLSSQSIQVINGEIFIVLQSN